jgi:L-iditol 2-dehydrogenase
MDALIKKKEGFDCMEVEDVPVPVPGPGEVLIKIKAAGICGSDVLFYNGSLTHCIPPVILGHEFSGEIIETDEQVEHYKVGDRVVSEPHKGGCGVCHYCQTGAVEACKSKRAIGYKIDGAFTSYIAMPETSLHRIPNNVSYEQAALSEPLAVAVKGILERAKVEQNDFAVVLGCGPIGLLAAEAIKASGARTVVITGTDGDENTRLKAARKMNIDLVVNVQKENLKEKVLQLTNGLGADLVVEAAGVEATISQAFDILRTDGRIAVLGHTGKDMLSMPWETGLHKAARVMWSFSSNWTSWEKTLSLLSRNQITTDEIITHKMPIKDWRKAINLLENLEAIKVLLIPEH